MLSIRQLHRLQPSSHVAQPIDLDVAAGECVAILGPSGSGKSVLLRLIADLDPGLARSRWTVWHVSRSAPDWRARVIYQAAESAWWSPDVLDHFPADRRDALKGMLPALGLSGAALTTEVSRLSTGERQRLGLIRTLCRQPAVALLDEPTASLDHASTMAVEALLRDRLSGGLAIVMVTHSAEQAARLAHRIFRMEAGVLSMVPSP